MKVGDEVVHRKHGKGIIRSTSATGVVVAQFAHGLEHTLTSNLRSLSAQREKHRRQAKKRQLERENLLRRRVLEKLKNGDFSTADDLYRRNCRQWWAQAEYSKVRAKEFARHELMEQDKNRKKVIELLKASNWDAANKRYRKKCASWWPAAEYERVKASQIQQAETARIVKLRAKVRKHLQAGRWNAADKLYQEKCTAWWPQRQYKRTKKAANRLVRYAQRPQHREAMLQHFKNADWKSANRLYESECSEWWAEKDYESSREVWMMAHRLPDIYAAESLKKLNQVWRRSFNASVSGDEWAQIALCKIRLRLAQVGMFLDKEQQLACARPEQHLLIKARAGSGKTRTLAAIAALAFKDEQLDSDQVLTLAFNTKAAKEVGERIKSAAGLDEYRNARTFHSLASRLAGDTGRTLVFDQGQGDPSRREQSQFVERAIRNILNPSLREKLYEFFRREIEQIERIGADLPDEDYFTFRRSLTLVTLSGKAVKSNGEKFIADYLFEHDIDFRYEKAWSWDRPDLIQGAAYRPDFSISVDGRDFILEHWAINPEDPDAEVPVWWKSTDTDQYRRQIADKRAWCQRRGVQLLETHTGMLSAGREAFESRLGEILQTAGIPCRKLPPDVLIDRVLAAPQRISRLAGLLLQFIQRAKKRAWTVTDAESAIRTSLDPEPRNRIFHELALRVYAEYERQLGAEAGMDFDDLLLSAIHNIKEYGAALRFDTDHKHRHSIDLTDLRWILLDEYQDFSELYYRMLEGILEVNPDLRIVAVGDDWQAINGFAGAQPIFFKAFRKYFEHGATVTIATNYRSARRIVNAGNALMAGCGVAARASSPSPGEIIVQAIDKEYVCFKSGAEFEDERIRDAIYFVGTPHGSGNSLEKGPNAATVDVAKALKACADFIIGSWKTAQDQTPAADDAAIAPRDVMLLSRTGRIYGVKLEEFEERLLSVVVNRTGLPMRDVARFIEVLTAHRAKGKEADAVIVLEATERNFPKVHGDNVLFAPFGVMMKDVLAEEQRLLYVAITRAERRLMLLTETGLESIYLSRLGFGRESDVADQSDEPAERAEAPDGTMTELAKHMRAAIDEVNPWKLRKLNLSPCLTPLLEALELSDLPDPEIGYTIKGDQNFLCAELAWPLSEGRAKVAIPTGPQLAHEDQWKKLGWRVAKADIPVESMMRGLHHYLDAQS